MGTNYNEIIDLIRSSNVSQSELSRRTGFHTTTINRWMTGKKTTLRPSTIQMVANALGYQAIWSNEGQTECSFIKIKDADTAIDRGSKKMADTNNTTDLLIEKLAEERIKAREQKSINTNIQIELSEKFESLKEEIEILKNGQNNNSKKRLPQHDIMGEFLDGAIEQDSLLDDSTFFGLAMLIIDKDNKVSRINPAFTQFFGYKSDDLYRKSVLDTVVTNGDVKALHAHISKVDISQPYLLNVKHKEGYPVPVKIRSKSISTLTHVNFKVLLFTVLKDMSDVWSGFILSEGDVETGEVYDVPLPIRAINPYMFFEHYGYSAKEAMKLNIIDLIHPDELKEGIQERNDNMKMAQDRDKQYASKDSRSEVAATTIEKYHTIKHKDGHYIKSLCTIRTHWKKRYTTIQFVPETINE